MVRFCAAIVVLPDVAEAQSQHGSVSMIDRATVWIYQQQRMFHRELTDNMRSYSDNGGWAAAWALIVASFLYAVFYAAGPGHGSAVMSGYLLTHGETVRRGMLLSVGAAFS